MYICSLYIPSDNEMCNYIQHMSYGPLERGPSRNGPQIRQKESLKNLVPLQRGTISFGGGPNFSMTLSDGFGPQGTISGGTKFSVTDPFPL